MMKNRTLLVFVAILALVSGFQGAAYAAEGSAVKQTILKVGQERTRAQVERNFGALDRLMGDDLTYTHASGFTQTKAELLGDLKSGRSVYKSITNSDVKVRVYGNTAVVTGHSDMVVWHGQTHHLSLLYLEVDAKRNGRWQMVAYQSTVAQP